MTSYANRLVTTVSAVASSGLGAFTISTASSGYRTFVAGDDGKSFDVSIVEGTAWEARTGCVYTHSGTSLARGTLEASSTGSAVAFTSAAVLTVTPTAAKFDTYDMAALLAMPETSITTTATATIGVMHVCSGTTADYTATLPAASGNTNKLIGFRMAPGLTKLVTIDGSGAELIDGAASRVMWANEVAILRCDGTAWTKVSGKTIPMYARIEAAASQSLANGSFTAITLGTVAGNVGSLTGTANTITVSRAGNYIVSGGGAATGTGSSAVLSTLIWSIFKAGAEFQRIFRGLTDNVSPGPTGGAGAFAPVALAAGDALTLSGFINGANYSTEYIAGTSLAFLSIQEQIQW